MSLSARVGNRLRTELEAMRARRPLRGEWADRLRSREGLLFGSQLPELPGGEAPPPGDIERYFNEYSEGPGIWKWQHYFPVYERHLSRFRGRDAHLIEIGIFSGGSLRMWRDYLGPGARITGIDIEPACKVYESDRILVAIGDQGDPAFWERFLVDAGPIDAVIDDGSHGAADQILTLKMLLPRLCPGGVFICEDTEGVNNEFCRFIDGFTRNLDALDPRTRPDGGDASATSPFQRSIASVHRYPFVTVIERTYEPLRQLEGPRHGTEWQPFL